MVLSVQIIIIQFIHKNLFVHTPPPPPPSFYYFYSNLERFTAAERRERDRAYDEDCLKDLRQAAEAHRQVRYDVQSWLKPGMKMFDIVERLEARSNTL